MQDSKKWIIWDNCRLCYQLLLLVAVWQVDQLLDFALKLPINCTKFEWPLSLFKVNII